MAVLNPLHGRQTEPAKRAVVRRGTMLHEENRKESSRSRPYNVLLPRFCLGFTRPIHPTSIRAASGSLLLSLIALTLLASPVSSTSAPTTWYTPYSTASQILLVDNQSYGGNLSVVALPHANQSSGKVSVNASVSNPGGQDIFWGAKMGFAFTFRQAVNGLFNVSTNWTLKWHSQVSLNCARHTCVYTAATTSVESILIVEDITTHTREAQGSKKIMHLDASSARITRGTNSTGNTTYTMSLVANLTAGDRYIIRAELYARMAAFSSLSSVGGSASLDLTSPYGGWLNSVTIT